MNEKIEGLLKTSWIPKQGGLPWKITDIYQSTTQGNYAVMIEKYQGGRNSPAIITVNRLKKNFVKVDT
jgi:hypothetical protein